MTTFDYWYDYIVRNGEFIFHPSHPYWQMKIDKISYQAYFFSFPTSPFPTNNNLKKMISINSPMFEGSGMLVTTLCDKDNFDNNSLMKNLTSIRKIV